MLRQVAFQSANCPAIGVFHRPHSQPSFAALMRRGASGYGKATMFAKFKNSTLRTAIAIGAMMVAAPSSAEEREVPYWASLRVNEVNMRVGPSEDYRISWVYRRQGLPLKVLRLKDGWRLVQDPGGTRGWMLSQFLTRQRSAIVSSGDPAEMREAADPASALRWRFPAGHVGKLGDCGAGWCQIDIGGRKGFIAQDRLWGAGEP